MASGFLGGHSVGSVLQNVSSLNSSNTNEFSSQGLPIAPNHIATAIPQQQQLPQIFLDQSMAPHPVKPQIPLVQNRFLQSSSSSSLIGKRTLAEFQAAQNHPFFQQQLIHPQQQSNQSNVHLSNLLLRSVKPRNMMGHYHQTSPISTLSPVDMSPGSSLTAELSSMSNMAPSGNRHPQNYPQLLQQQQIMQFRASQSVMKQAGASNYPVARNRLAPGVGGLTQQDSSFPMDKKLIVDKRLQELEKQLLDDEDVAEENDIVSVITNIENNVNENGSEWSETFHLISGSDVATNAAVSSNPISPSPSSSSSSTSSVTNVVSNCSRQTLLDAASAISESKNDVALEILSRCPAQASPNASPEQKLVGFLANALKHRVSPLDNSAPVAEMFTRDHVESTSSLYELSPCFKLGFMAANLAIVDAARDYEVFNVLDFDIDQGGQYVSLLHALSSARATGKVPSVLKLTAVYDNGNPVNAKEEDDRLSTVGDMLTRLGEHVGIKVCFNAVRMNRLSSLSRATVGVEENEAVAVNFAFKLYRIPDESVSIENPRDELLRRVKGLSPVVVTVVEQELNINTAPFLTRVNEMCSYYCPLLESIEATVAKESTERARAESGIGRRIANSLACEGRERVERCEVFGKWRSRFSMAGFVSNPLNQSAAESLLARLSSGNRVNPGFTVTEEGGRVCVGWMGKTLTVTSAWR